MLTKEEFLKKIGQSEEELKAKGLELMFIGEVGYGDEDDGWDVVYIDPSRCVEVGMGCKCSYVPLHSVHDKL
ncbi:MAG: hypothetical protein ACRC51_08010 [Cetobacterium sp.]